LSINPTEIGGGGQITNLWRTLFVQGTFGRWSTAGQRVFIDSKGTRFPLGIPLSVEASSIEVSAGWRFEPNSSRGVSSRLVPYVGGGAGVVRYSESSSFAQVGDDLEQQHLSYHAVGGLEVGVARWVSVAADVRYRVVPGILGEGGVSAIVEEKTFNGLSVSARVLIGNRPRSLSADKSRKTPVLPSMPVAEPELLLAEPESSVASRGQPAEKPVTSGRRDPLPQRPNTERGFSDTALLTKDSGVFVRPGALQPLRMLTAGTRVKVREEYGEWLMIEFKDPQWGVRVGYVLRANCDWR
jgi:hypothetical protein